jgi:hypothetical protein
MDDLQYARGILFRGGNGILMRGSKYSRNTNVGDLIPKVSIQMSIDTYVGMYNGRYKRCAVSKVRHLEVYRVRGPNAAVYVHICTRVIKIENTCMCMAMFI